MNVLFSIARHRVRWLRYWLAVLAIGCVQLSSAQYENIWVFGQQAGLDFNGSVPVPVTTDINGFGEGNASICDAGGQLMFYTEGSVVRDRQNNIMPNGDDIISALSGNFAYLVTSSTSQGTVIVPIPDHPEQYYVFSLTSWESGQYWGRLYYSIVDMNLNGGMGDVVTGQKAILMDSLLGEQMTAVAGDNCNTWLLIYSRTDKKIKAFEITSTGISPTTVLSAFTNSLFPADSLQPGFSGCIAVSPDRSKIAITQGGGSGGAGNGLTLFDFDPATAMLSNERQLSPAAAGYGACFSPDNTKLYFSYDQWPVFFVCQFDLTAGNLTDILNSKANLSLCGFTHLKLAPDNKIYFLAPGSTETSLSVINQPNQPGIACQFQGNVLTLATGTSMHGGFPNVIVPRPEKHSAFTFQRADHFNCLIHAAPIAALDTSGRDYIWSTGDTITSLIIDTPGRYWVSYMTPCTFHTDTFEVSFPNVAPVLNIKASCKNGFNGLAWLDPYPYPADTATCFYTWKSTGDTAILSVTDSLPAIPGGHYQVRITTLSGCDTTLSFYLQEEDHRVSFEADTLICKGDTIQFHNTSPPDFNTYSWSLGNGDTSILQQPSKVYDTAGHYTVILVGTGDVCTDTAYKSITVDAPVEDLSFSKDKTTACTGIAFYFSPNSDSTTVDLLWNLGDGNNLTGPYENIQHAYDTSGLMTVQLTAHFRACPDISFSDTVTAYPFPSVDLGHDSVLCLHGPSIELVNYQPHNTGDAYLWNTGETTPAISALHPGQYSLTVTSEHNCATTDTVEVNKDCYIDIPNAFTPNGDGVNDYFFPRQLLSKSVSAFRMQVFNRWGQVVFATTNIDGRGWDGRFNNNNQPAGVYVYLIEVGFDNGKQEKYKGNLTLIR